MALPTKKKPLKKKESSEQIQKAIKTVESLSSLDRNSKKEIIKTNQLKNPTKTMGRPSPVKNRQKFTLLLSEETFDRFQFAFVKQQIEYKKKNKVLDKSLLIETVLKKWLDSSGH